MRSTNGEATDLVSSGARQEHLARAEHTTIPRSWNHLPAGVSTQEWNDWRWQLRHAVGSVTELERYLELSEDERLGFAAVSATGRMPVRLTPYVLGLCDPVDPSCPIRRQFLPRQAEGETVPGDLADPLGEREHEVSPGLIRRYPDRALLIVTASCGAHCRFCTRSRVVAVENGYMPTSRLEAAVEWLERHPDVREVIVSGGDPLVASNQKIRAVLQSLASVPSIEVIRVGSRVPSVLPMRVDQGLVEALRQPVAVWLMTHFNHPKELTSESLQALGRLVDGGIPVMNQTVLLRGINDDPTILQRLFRGLIRARVKPYYLLHADVVAGTGHMRTSIRRSIGIYAALQGRLSGLAVPRLIVDTPGGKGKVAIGPDSIVEQAGGRTVLRTFRGELVELLDPPDSWGEGDE